MDMLVLIEGTERCYEKLTRAKFDVEVIKHGNAETIPKDLTMQAPHCNMGPVYRGHGASLLVARRRRR